jgi:hypothetical protein
MAKGSEFFAGDDVVMELPKHDRPLTRYPEFALTANTDRGYLVNRSSIFSFDWEGYKAFNRQRGTNLDWISASTYTSGVYGGSQKITDVNGTDYDGEWIKLQLPKAIRLEKFSLVDRDGADFTRRLPKDGTLLGSNDGTGWEVIHTWTGRTFITDIDNWFHVNSTKYYKHFGLVAEALKNDAGATSWDMGEIKYYGTEEGDTSVDVVHRSIPNKPGQQHLEVYWDANDSNSYSFADSSSVYDLSGSGATGTLTNGVGFDTEYNAFTFDGTSQYIEKVFSGYTQANEYSASVWFKSDSYTSDSFIFQLGLGDHSNGSGIGMNIESEGPLRAYIYGYGLSSNVSLSVDTIATGIWYHATATYYSTGKNELYVNGVLVGEGNTPQIGTISASAPLTIGTYYVSSARLTPTFNGSIANFRLFGKALNADQVRELYEYDAPRFGHRQNLVALHKGNLGVGVAHPTSRFEVAGTETLQEYPPKAMTGYETYMEGHGVFRASASSTWSNNLYEAFGAFNKTLLAGTPDLTWNSVASGFSSGSDYAYTGTNSLGGISGEWLKLSTPYAINPSTIKITVASSYINNHAPEDFYLLGSVDDATWYVLAQETGETWSSLSHTSSINTTNTYKYFALVVTKTRGADNTNVTEMQVFGTPAPSGLEDGHLTLGKALTLPRVSGHPTGAETPRAESLVVHYDTTVDSVVSGSTVVDTSGNGLNGALENGSTYSSSLRAFQFDGTNDWLSAPINNSGGAWVHSMSFWFKFNGGSAGGLYSLVHIGAGASTQNIMSDVLVYTDGKIRFGFYANDSDTATGLIDPNIWYHVVCTYNGGAGNASSRLVYINGQSKTLTTVGAYTSSTLNLAANTDVYLGSQQGNSSFPGSISNFKLYNVVLTAEEVAMEYALGRTGKSLNLTDTALCLGGTVPRAQLDVRGTGMFDGGLVIKYKNSLEYARDGGIMMSRAGLGNVTNKYSSQPIILGGGDSGAIDGNLRGGAIWSQWGGSEYGIAMRGASLGDTYPYLQDPALFVTKNNVGIGTTSPAAKLHIETSSTSSGSVMRVDASSVTNTGYSEIQMVGPGQTSQGLSIFCNGSGRTTDGGASATTVRNNNGPIILGSSSYVNRIRKPKDDDFICGKWTTTLDASAATTVITNLRSCVSTPSAGGTNMSGNIGRFTAPEDGYYFACCQVRLVTRNSSNLLIVYDAGGTNFATNNPNIGTYNEIIDLRNADNVEQSYNIVFVMHMEQNNYIQFRVHSSGYTESSSKVMQCYAYLLNRI